MEQNKLKLLVPHYKFHNWLSRFHGITEITNISSCLIVIEKTSIKQIICLGPLDNDMMYSLDACYTPAQGEGPCTAEEALKIENETPRNVITMNFFIFKCFFG